MLELDSQAICEKFRECLSEAELAAVCGDDAVKRGIEELRKSDSMYYLWVRNTYKSNLERIREDAPPVAGIPVS